MKKILLASFTVTAAIGYHGLTDKTALPPITLANVEALTNGNEDGELNPNIGNGMRREDCHDKSNRIIGSHCVPSSDPSDQCNYSMSWGNC